MRASEFGNVVGSLRERSVRYSAYGLTSQAVKGRSNERNDVRVLEVSQDVDLADDGMKRKFV